MALTHEEFFMRLTGSIVLAVAVAGGVHSWSMPAMAQADGTTTAATGMPAPEKIMDAALKAVGGKEAVESIKTLHAVMSMDMMGMEITMDTKWSRAGGRLHKMSMPMGEMLMGTDGKVKWKRDPMGYALIEGEEAKQFDSQVDMFGMVLEPHRKMKENVKSIEVAAKESFEGVECYRLHIVDKDDEKSNVFFEVESGLPRGLRHTVETEMGPMTSTILFKDWQPEAGVKFFRAIKITTDNEMMPEMEMKVTKVVANKIEDSEFALPDEVKKLAEEAKNAPPAEEIKLEDLSAEHQAQVKQILDSMKQAGKDVIKQQLPQMEQGARYAPAEMQPMFKYLIQELKKELARTDSGGVAR